MSSWTGALSRTRGGLSGGLKRLFKGRKTVSDDVLDEIEESLILADIPPRLASEWVDEIRVEGVSEDAWAHISRSISESLDHESSVDWNTERDGPRIILLVGVNGSGKTTTAAKLAHHIKEQGLRPLLAATDTFRAAGTDQLRLWAERVDCEIVAGATGSDASAVAFDAVEAAKARGHDVVIIDTAGRMHTKQNLMEELKKLHRAIAKAQPGAPHDSWIVLDASLGANAVQQALRFGEAVALNGLVLTKLDGSSRGGFVLGIKQELGIPVRYAGLGEGMQDLVPFDAGEFARALTGTEEG